MEAGSGGQRIWEAVQESPGQLHCSQEVSRSTTSVNKPTIVFGFKYIGKLKIQT